MTTLSASQLETLRSHPQRTILYLSIFQPRSIMKCRVNNASSGKGDRTIIYDGVSLGGFSAVEAGMTLLVGTTDGAQDIGKVRIRSATSSQFVVSENSNIVWADDLFLTVQRYWELWPVFSRIIRSGDEDVTFFKDYDITYSNQNSVLGTFPNAGPHRGLFKGENAYYSSTGSFNLLGDTLNYNWAFEGGTPTGSASANPGNVIYSTPGDYVTRLIISGSSGGIDTTYRYVSVYDRPGEGSDPPIQKWEITSMGGSRDEGGFKASIRVHETTSIEENAVVVIFADDWYGSTQTSIGGNYPSAEKIFFAGHILEGSIHYDWRHSYVDFQVGSITEVMKDALGFAVSVESKSSPSVWYEVLDMDGRRALYHYLKWHTTALQIADFQFIGNDQKIQYFDSDRTSMYDAIDNYMRNTLLGKVVADRQGRVWMEQDARAYPVPLTSFSSVVDITRRDWVGEPSIDERQSDRISYLEYGGIAYSGVSTGTFSAHLANAPGGAPSFRGRLETHEGLAIAGQTQINQMVGNAWANANAPYPRIGLELGINARNLDIAPQEAVQINIPAGDTVRNAAINGRYIPQSMDWKYDPRSQILLPGVDFVSLVNGGTGDTIAIASSPDEAEFGGGGAGGGWEVPGLQVPPRPITTWPSIVDTLIAKEDMIITMSAPSSYTIKHNRGLMIVTSAPNITASTIAEILCTQPGLYVAHLNVEWDTQSASDVNQLYIAGAGVQTTSRMSMGGVSYPYGCTGQVVAMMYSTIPFTVSFIQVGGASVLNSDVGVIGIVRIY